MLLLAGSDARSPLLIAQSSHAFLAWQLAEHWGNRSFPRPAPRPEVLAAILLHDSGWSDVDPDPGIDGEGRPRTFDRMPIAEQAAIWRGSVGRAAQLCRYAGLLVAAHFALLAEIRTRHLLERGDTHGARSAQAFRAEMQRRQAVWRETLAADARFQPFLAGPGYARNAALFAAWDRVAVHLCAGLTPPLSIEVPGADGEPRAVILEPIGERRFRVRPWPLEGARLQLHCEGRRLAGTTFASDEELREAISGSPAERVSFTLERCSARS